MAFAMNILVDFYKNSKTLLMLKRKRTLLDCYMTPNGSKCTNFCGDFKAVQIVENHEFSDID